MSSGAASEVGGLANAGAAGIANTVLGNGRGAGPGRVKAIHRLVVVGQHLAVF